MFGLVSFPLQFIAEHLLSKTISKEIVVHFENESIKKKENSLPFEGFEGFECGSNCDWVPQQIYRSKLIVIDLYSIQWNNLLGILATINYCLLVASRLFV